MQSSPLPQPREPHIRPELGFVFIKIDSNFKAASPHSRTAQIHFCFIDLDNIIYTILMYLSTSYRDK